MLTPTDIKNTIDSVKYNLSGVETLLSQRDMLKSAVETYKKQRKDLEDKIIFLNDTKTYYVKAIDLMYEESIGALKETLNAALQYVVYDKNYSCNLTLEDKRGSKNLYISIIDNDEDGLEMDWKDSVGQGIRAILSFVLKAFYLINQDSNILVLDEKYSTISDLYIPRFFEFLNKFCEEREFIIVWITHDPRFMDYADKTYLVSDGHIRLMGKSDSDVVEEEKEL